jgi:hypothetical protein
MEEKKNSVFPPPTQSLPQLHNFELGEKKKRANFQLLLGTIEIDFNLHQPPKRTSWTRERRKNKMIMMMMKKGKLR